MKALQLGKKIVKNIEFLYFICQNTVCSVCTVFNGFFFFFLAKIQFFLRALIGHMYIEQKWENRDSCFDFPLIFSTISPFCVHFLYFPYFSSTFPRFRQGLALCFGFKSPLSSYRDLSLLHVLIFMTEFEF